MNATSSPDDHLPAGERFVDAALSEHARLGRDARDAELIHRILLETVHRQPASVEAARVRKAGRHRWLTGTAATLTAAAALVILTAVALSIPGTGLRERASDELHFTVRLLETPVPTDKATVSAEAPQLAAARYAAPISFSAPPSPPASVASGADPVLASSGYELITTLGPSFETLPATGSRQENFRITADESLASSDRRLYHGRVVVEHALYRIEASEVSVPVPGRAQTGGPSPLLARNVTVTQESPHRVAHAKSLRFDPLSGAIVLTGVESFETGGGKLARFAPGDQLVLNGEGFSVESPAAGSDPSPRGITP